MARNSDGTVVKRTGVANKGATLPAGRNPLARSGGTDPNGAIAVPTKKKPV